ncbi:MAG TPA: tetratricopeptide repeat protein [Thermoanaerobaculia bacterium]|nr:tetratricopeptide repeat protein [Thermoanaerobaculia bacterium]
MRPTATTPILLILLLAAGAGAVMAQPPASPAAPERPPAAADPGESPEEAAAKARFGQALEQLAAGDLEAAIATLEPFRTDPRTPPPALALLGALYLEAGRPADSLAVLEPLARAEEADPGALYNAGRAALALGREEAAERYLERSVEREPDTPAARELGLLRGRQGQLAESYRLLVPWAQQHPEDQEARLAGAHAALALARVPAAESLLSDLPQSDPAVRLLWGRLLLLKSDPHGAVATLKPLVASGAPPAVELDARRMLAEAHLVLGDSASAVALLEGRAGDPAVALQLVRAQYQSGDLDGALATLAPFASALESGAPSLPTALRGLLAAEYGRLLMTASRFDEALVHLRIATELRPVDKEAWLALGQTLGALGRMEEAQATLARFDEIANSEVPTSVRSEALERGVSDPTGRQVAEAIRLISVDRADEALALLRQEIALAPEDVRPRLLESRAYLALSRPEEALAAAERALGIAAENADAHYQRGTVLMVLERFEDAETELRRAIELSPNHTAAMGDLGVLLLVRGRRDEARELFERILEIRPDDPLAARHLESLGSPSAP